MLILAQKKDLEQPNREPVPIFDAFSGTSRCLQEENDEDFYDVCIAQGDLRSAFVTLHDDGQSEIRFPRAVPEKLSSWLEVVMYLLEHGYKPYEHKAVF